MLRRVIATATVSLALVAGATTASAPPAGAAFDNSIGIVKSADHRWKGGCADYTIRWNFTPPTPDWTVVARIRSPKGFSIRSEFWDSNSPNLLGQLRGKKRVPLCGSSVKPGRYKIEMQMIYTDADNDRVTHTVNRAPTYFRLTRR